MTIITALILVPGLLGIVYYLRRIALAPEQPTVQTRGLGGGGRLAK